MQVKIEDAARLLRAWLQARLAAGPLAWLDGAAADAAQADDAALERTLALAGRRAGRGALDLAPHELAQAEALCPGWSPSEWTLADAARALVLCGRAGDGSVGATFRALCRTADLPGLIGLYRTAPLLPWDAEMDWQMGEGLRTSIAAVFEAIAHRSPLPRARFERQRWNHMVLKALFIESTLPPIVGLDAGRNAALAAVLVDHVRERRAAGRPVDPYVWRCIAPFADSDAMALAAPLAGGDACQRRTAALFLHESPVCDADLAAQIAPETALIRNGDLDWSRLGG